MPTGFETTIGVSVEKTSLSRAAQEINATISKINKVQLQLDRSKFPLGRITGDFNKFNQAHGAFI